jgi:MFS family permease
MVARNVPTVPEATPGAHRWWALTAVEYGNFVVYMDGFIVTLALPTMARQFAVSLSVLKWVLVAYLLDVTVTLLPAGRLADIRGAQTHHRRRHDRARRQFGAVRGRADRGNADRLQSSAGHRWGPRAGRRHDRNHRGLSEARATGFSMLCA